MVQELSATDAGGHRFSLLASDGPECPDQCTLVLVSLVEGDKIEIETLELIEMRAATCTVNAPVRGHDMTFFHILRNPRDVDEFEILALIAPKNR